MIHSRWTSVCPCLVYGRIDQRPHSRAYWTRWDKFPVINFFARKRIYCQVDGAWFGFKKAGFCFLKQITLQLLWRIRWFWYRVVYAVELVGRFTGAFRQWETRYEQEFVSGVRGDVRYLHVNCARYWQRGCCLTCNLRVAYPTVLFWIEIFTVVVQMCAWVKYDSSYYRIFHYILSEKIPFSDCEGCQSWGHLWRVILHV